MAGDHGLNAEDDVIVMGQVLPGWRRRDPAVGVLQSPRRDKMPSCVAGAGAGSIGHADDQAL